MVPFVSVPSLSTVVEEVLALKAESVTGPVAVVEGEALGRRRDAPLRIMLLKSDMPDESGRGSTSGLMGLFVDGVTNMAFRDWELFPWALEAER